MEVEYFFRGWNNFNENEVKIDCDSTDILDQVEATKQALDKFLFQKWEYVEKHWKAKFEYALNKLIKKYEYDLNSIIH